MTALAVLAIGAGAYLCYYAVRNQTAHPVAHAKSELSALGGGSTTPTLFPSGVNPQTLTPGTRP